MLFSSIVFLCYFFPIVLAGYYILRFSRKAQNIWLLCASLFFYAWGEPANLLLIVLSIVVNWRIGILLERYEVYKKRLLVVAIVLNIGTLVVYKYLDFLIDNINAAVGRTLLARTEIALPIGISFFTFQALSYVIDVYRKKNRAEKSLYLVGLYISFFPQLIAGPIIQYSTIADQIRGRRESLEKVANGVCRFTVGLGKKIILANQFAVLADYIFGWSAVGQEKYIVPAMLAWLGVIAYTLQIYFDFSAYSDMAIGLGLMFGFTFAENFNYPYISKSVTEFWRRWHISLTRWFREYIYFPLGGSRLQNKDKVVRNLFIVWLCTGIWHGASWNFLLWGMWNFVFILAERFFEVEKRRIPALVGHVYTMGVCIIGWSVFRAQDLYQAGELLQNMFLLNHNGFYSSLAVVLAKEYSVFLLAGILFSTPIARRMEELLKQKRMGKCGAVYTVAYPLCLMAVLIVCMTYMTRGTYNPFIYFNF